MAILRAFSLGLAVGTAAGCAHGPISGRFSSPGHPPAEATLKYRSSVLGGSGTLSMTLPTGEHFTGPYRLVPHDPKRQMTAHLVGDRGSTMVCRFTLNEPGIGPDGGGIVHCQLSAGGGFDASY